MATTAPLFSALPGGIAIDSAGVWMADFAAHRAAFLADFGVLDFSNITVIEMKALLRKYGLARTGKKVELEDRIRQVAQFLQDQIAKERVAVESDGKESGTKQSSSSSSNNGKALDEQLPCDPSIYINA